MDDIARAGNHRHLDYPQAAQRLLVALSFIATKGGGKLANRPVPAVQLVAHCFDREVRRHWSHETRRRRIRDTVAEARKQLADQTGASPSRTGVTLVANGEGYWLTGDRQLIAWYAGRRRRHGLQDLAAGSQAKQQLAAQPSLFPSPSAWRH